MRAVQEEAQGHYGDEKFPKIQFPSPEACPRCRKPDGSVDEAETAQFLMQIYQPLRTEAVGTIPQSVSLQEEDAVEDAPVRRWTRRVHVLGYDVGPVRLLCFLGAAWFAFSCFWCAAPKRCVA